MRPVLLEMQAFGPYAELQVIDFTMLKDVNMFLIHGATGGGKTTVLDAICYALYGDTSGNERDAESMRSHFAKEDIITEVKLTFTIRESTYFIHRIPVQERPKKTGTGFTVQNPVAELYRVSGEERELLASGINRTKDKIIEIIGFDSDQFRQVIMIPQGQFRKLLVAESEERQKILGEIFQTRKYKQVEEKLRQEEKKLKDKVAAIKERRKEQIRNIKYGTGTLLEGLIQKESVDVVQIITEVNNNCKLQEEELKQLQNDIEQNKDNMDQVSKKITQAIQNRDKHNEKQRVEQKLKELKDKEEVYVQKDQEYKLAHLALPLRTVEQYIHTLSLQKEKIQNELLVNSEKAKELETRYSNILKQVRDCEEEEGKIKELDMEYYRASEEYLPKVITLTKIKIEQKELQDQIQKMQEEEKVLNNRKDGLEKEIQEAEIALGNRQKLNDQLRDCEVKGEKLSNTLAQRNRLLELEASYQGLRLEYKQVYHKKKEHEKEYVVATQEHNDLLQLWMQGQASVLAETLKENKECPVCGSTTHPKPAKTTMEIPSEAQINDKKTQLDKAHQLYLDAENNRVRIEAEGKASAEQLKAQQELLGDYAKVSIEDIEKSYKSILRQQKQINKELTILNQLEQKVASYKKEKRSIDEKRTHIQQNITASSQQFISLTTSINQIEKEIPKELQDSTRLENHIYLLQKTLTQMKDRHKKAKDELEKISALKIKTETIEKEKTLQLQEIQSQYEKEFIHFEKQRNKAGFKSLEEYKSAYRPEEMLANLNEEIKDYYKQIDGLEAQHNQLKKETQNIILMDIEELETKYKELGDLADALSRRHQSIMDEKTHNENQIKIILESEKQIKNNEKKYSIAGDLYKVARGNNIRGLSFERFIQSALFEDILIRANERLQLMSNNRYELYRSDNRRTMASQSGLEMEVLDTYTGRRRHVKTLSGGEGFMASLSLALGLADVVQSYAGGISLDTIFIDEGFGTLDSEALDSAIKTLIDLQQSGRLVGIISHVPELKERIGARIEVVTSQRGSRAKFYV